MNAHVSKNSGNNEWYSPPEIVEAARRVLGGFDLDPASSEIANERVQARQFFTYEDNGLLQRWPVGRIWMNPPYAQPLIGQFSGRFAEAVRDGSTGIVLVNNATETTWFHTLARAASAICLPKQRVRFLDPNGVPGAPLQGQAIFYAGDDTEGFNQEFGGFGMVLRNCFTPPKKAEQAGFDL